MRLCGIICRGVFAVSFFLALELPPAARAQVPGGAAVSAPEAQTSVTLPEVNISAQADQTFFAPDDESSVRCAGAAPTPVSG
jgi:hypothetical protein